MRVNKNLVLCVMVGLLAFGSVGCSKVPAGTVGVKVHMLGSSKGVDYEVVGPGRYWIGPNTELYRFPTLAQNYVWTRDPEEGSPDNEEIPFQTKEGLSLQADVGVTYRIDPEKVGPIFEKYRKGVDEITDIYLRNMVRDAFVTIASNKDVETIYGVGKAAMVDSVEAMVRSQVEPLGIMVEKIYLINDLRLPPQVVQALNDKIAATQRAQQRENEVREAEAQAQKDIAAANGEAQSILLEAKAQAEANRILSQSITGELVSYKSIEKWDGVLPKFTGNGAIPFVTVDAK